MNLMQTSKSKAILPVQNLYQNGVKKSDIKNHLNSANSSI